MMIEFFFCYISKIFYYAFKYHLAGSLLFSSHLMPLAQKGWMMACEVDYASGSSYRQLRDCIASEISQLTIY